MHHGRTVELKEQEKVEDQFNLALAKEVDRCDFLGCFLGNNDDLKTQVCYLACVAEVSILDRHEEPTSVIAYKSHEMDRSASNVLSLP